MFWQYFNNIPRPLSFFTSKNARRKLVGNRKVDALSIFREGIKPEWEDPVNADGGELLFRGSDLEMVDKMWYELFLSMVGEVMPQGELLVGARVIDKSGKGKNEYRIELWFSNGLDVQCLTPQLTGKLNDNMGAIRTLALQPGCTAPPCRRTSPNLLLENQLVSNRMIGDHQAMLAGQ